MGLFDRLKEPVFLKESSNAEEQLEKLKALKPLLNLEGQAIIRQDIKCLEYGIVGEKNIAFELKNSHLPMYILHDLYLEDGELSAQIDYLVFTKKSALLLSVKILFAILKSITQEILFAPLNLAAERRRKVYIPLSHRISATLN